MIVIEYEINEEVQEMLRQLPGPIGVVSVAGMYRTGKSYLLNRMLLNRSGGFGVGPTINPCTKVSLRAKIRLILYVPESFKYDERLNSKIFLILLAERLAVKF